MEQPDVGGLIRLAVNSLVKLPPARMGFHRQTYPSPYTSNLTLIGATGVMQHILAIFFTQHHCMATHNGLAPHFQHASRADARGGGGQTALVHRVSGPEPSRLRTRAGKRSVPSNEVFNRLTIWCGLVRLSCANRQSALQ